MAKADLPKLFRTLAKYGPVVAPVRVGENVVFREVTSLEEVELEYTRSLTPPKKLFLGPQEEILKFDGEKYEEVFEDGKAVLFGVHACDINGLLKLDEIYLDSPQDEYYARRRENVMIVGMSCVPDERCFCTSTGSSYAYGGFDLFLHDIGREYVVRVRTERGYEFTKDGYFKRMEEKDFLAFKKAEEKKVRSIKRKVDLAGIGDLIDVTPKSLWEELTAKCLACGSCNLVCPTCQCYDVLDVLELDIRSGSRIRRWDSCMLKRHALVAGGGNFRPTVVERTANRLSCKVGGEIRCVGCGRCTVYCPAKIDLVEMLERIRVGA